jgi:K+-transporting ATPase A subunit
MTTNGWFQIIVFLLVILAVTKPLGVFMTKVFNHERTFLDPVVRPLERLLYFLTRVDENHDMRWAEYAFAMLLFSGVSMAVLYVIERVQQFLPWNPQKLARKKYVPASLGTFPVTTPLFSELLVGVIVIIGALTFFPAVSLGPVLEHLLMQAGKTF